MVCCKLKSSISIQDKSIDSIFGRNKNEQVHILDLNKIYSTHNISKYRYHNQVKNKKTQEKKLGYFISSIKKHFQGTIV